MLCSEPCSQPCSSRAASCRMSCAPSCFRSCVPSCAVRPAVPRAYSLAARRRKKQKKGREFWNSLLRRSLKRDYSREGAEKRLGLVTKRNECSPRRRNETKRGKKERTAEAVSASHGSRLGESVFGPSNVVRAPAASQRECRWRLWQQSSSRSRSNAAVQCRDDPRSPTLKETREETSRTFMLSASASQRLQPNLRAYPSRT